MKRLFRRTVSCVRGRYGRGNIALTAQQHIDRDLSRGLAILEAQL